MASESTLPADVCVAQLKEEIDQLRAEVKLLNGKLVSAVPPLPVSAMFVSVNRKKQNKLPVSPTCTARTETTPAPHASRPPPRSRSGRARQRRKKQAERAARAKRAEDAEETEETAVSAVCTENKAVCAPHRKTAGGASVSQLEPSPSTAPPTGERGKESSTERKKKRRGTPPADNFGKLCLQYKAAYAKLQKEYRRAQKQGHPLRGFVMPDYVHCTGPQDVDAVFARLRDDSQRLRDIVGASTAPSAAFNFEALDEFPSLPRPAQSLCIPKPERAPTAPDLLQGADAPRPVLPKKEPAWTVTTRHKRAGRVKQQRRSAADATITDIVRERRARTDMNADTWNGLHEKIGATKWGDYIDA